MEKEKVCECELCGIEKKCGLVGLNDGKPFYACVDCIQEELRNAFNMKE